MTQDSKIGIGIVHCQSQGSTSPGFTKMFMTDSGQWSSIIDDTGDIFNLVSWKSEEILRMIKFVQDGWYMCSMKQIAGRDEEYRASWIYFPASIELSPDDIMSIVEKTESQIKNVNFDESFLNDIVRQFNKQLPNAPKYQIYTQQRGFAYFYYSDNNVDRNLYDLFSCIYQKEFTKFDWVLLMAKDSLYIKRAGYIENISDIKLKESFIINPLTDPKGFIPYIVQGNIQKKFDAPIRIIDGESLSIVWKKDGYKDIHKEIKRKDDNINLTPDKYVRRYPVKIFKVVDKLTRRTIDRFTLSIPGCEEFVDKRNCRFFDIKESELSNVIYTCTAAGYKEANSSLDLSKFKYAEPIEIQLEPETHSYQFVLELQDDTIIGSKKINKKVNFSIASQQELTNEDVKKLIPGYLCESTLSEKNKNILRVDRSCVNRGGGNTNGTSKRNQPEYKGGYAPPVNGNGGNTDPQGPHPRAEHSSTKEKLNIWGVCAIIVAVIVGLIYLLFSWLFGDDEVSTDKVKVVQTEQTSEKIEQQPAEQPADTWSQAYKYLQEHNGKIVRNDMEKYPELQGLYDMINKYRFSDFVNFIDNHKHKNDILRIEEWKRLYEKSKEINANKTGAYNSEDQEQSIEFEKCFRKINRFTIDVEKQDNSHATHPRNVGTNRQTPATTSTTNSSTQTPQTADSQNNYR